MEHIFCYSTMWSIVRIKGFETKCEAWAIYSSFCFKLSLKFNIKLIEKYWDVCRGLSPPPVRHMGFKIWLLTPGMGAHIKRAGSFSLIPSSPAKQYGKKDNYFLIYKSKH